MKIPKTFVPEKDLSNKVAELSSDKAFKGENIEDFILWKESSDVFGMRDMDDVIFKAEYGNWLDSSLVNKKIMVDYEHKTHVHIIQFLDQKSLKSNLTGAARLVKAYDQSNLHNRYRAFFKDAYLVFVHFSWLDTKKSYLKYINAYKSMGLEEVKT